MDKKKMVIISIIAVLIVILGVLIYFKPWDSNENNSSGGESVGQDTTTSSAPATPLLDNENPGNGSMYGDSNSTRPQNIPGYKPSYIPESSTVDNPVPTERSPQSAPPNVIATNSARDMFSYPVKTDYGVRESITDVLNKYGTDRAKQVGFRPWWLGDDHTAEWKMAAVRGNQVIESSANIESEEYTANDTVKYIITVSPRMNAPTNTSKLPDVSLNVWMKNVDGKWLIDAYEIDPNTYPSFH